MSDELENNLLDQVRPVFPQLSENLIRNAIKVVREGDVNGVTVAALLPICIDFLLDMPLETINDRNLQYVGSGMGINLNTRNEKNDDRSCNSPRNQSPASEENIQNALLNSDDSFEDFARSINRGTFDAKMRDYKAGFSSTSPSPSSVSSSSSSQLSADVYSNDERNNEAGNGLVDMKNTRPAPSSSSLFDRPRTNGAVHGVQQNGTLIVHHISPFEEACKTVVSICPDVEEKFALAWLKEKFPNMDMDPGQMANGLLEYLFECPNDFPKNKKEGSVSAPEKLNLEQETPDVDYFTLDRERHVYAEYNYSHQSIMILEQTFREIPMKDLRSIFWKERSLARAWKFIADRIRLTKKELSKCKENEETASSFKCLQRPRPSRLLPQVLDREVEKERNFITSYLQKQIELADHEAALSLNVKQYQEEGQLIQCGCCFDDVVFEQIIQCIEGHLFCIECLRSYAREAIHGSGKMQLSCMTSECTSCFPESQLRKALDSKMMEKYQERLQDESIKLAELPDLVKCPFCDFAAEVPKENKVFICQNPKCLAETCRYCKEKWMDHFGIPCNEIERKSEKNLRTSYEEKMTMAKIRTCEKCGCGFMKTDGCNKMTCRCGTTMCYVCRKARIGYGHFCSHPRDPGKACDSCTKCSLWSDPTEDDERAVRELQQEAVREAEKVSSKESEATGFVQSGKKRPVSIGPPEEEENGMRRKRKKHYNQQNHHHHHHRHHYQH